MRILYHPQNELLTDRKTRLLVFIKNSRLGPLRLLSHARRMGFVFEAPDFPFYTEILAELLPLSVFSHFRV